MHKPVITVIGAASLTFGPKLLRDILNHPEVDGCEFRFCDFHDEHLDIHTRLAGRLLATVDHCVRVSSSSDRKVLLPGSDLVLISIESSDYELWEKDYTIPREYGSLQVSGELGGPGGLMHALRQIPLHLDIAHDIERLCPSARVMVMSNPLNRICQAIHMYARTGEVIGLCHGVELAENLYINRMLGIDGEDIEATAAGVNHLTWILDIRRKSTGENLYPALRHACRTHDPSFQPLSKHVCNVFGWYSATGDRHMGEYLAYAADFMDLGTERFSVSRENDRRRWEYLEGLASSRIPLDEVRCEPEQASEELVLLEFLKPRSWVDTLSIPIVAAEVTNRLHRMPAVNLVNTGQIQNLPHGVFVETPGAVDGAGLRPVHVGSLPSPLAAICRRDIDQLELIVEAGATGDRNLALQAVHLDPVTHSVRAAEKMLDRLLSEYGDWLPYF